MIKKERTSFDARFRKELARRPPNRLRQGVGRSALDPEAGADRFTT
ncbi:hypothetical protein [Sphingomonas sp. ACRSK]|nr:hypothetical protein [Sphingomonas sp. ACRSK]MCG7347051.1 hypothetical protein [Sphingomonas sp. ACRSK]